MKFIGTLVPGNCALKIVLEVRLCGIAIRNREEHFFITAFHLIGYQQRLVECVRKDDRSYVNEKMCIKTQSKPMTKRPCNLKPCAAE